MDPFRNGAAGVVSLAKLFRPEEFAELTTPSAALSVASQLLVDAAATPPLRGGEYSTCNISSIRSHFPRPPLQFKRKRTTAADSMWRRRASPAYRRLQPSRRPHSRRRRGRCLESDPRNRLHLLCSSLRFRRSEERRVGKECR